MATPSWKVVKALVKDLNLEAKDVPLLAGETVHADQRGVCAGMNEIIDRDNPFNADVSLRLAAQVGGEAGSGPGIRQRDIALKKGETYMFSLYARGSGSLTVTFTEEDASVFTRTFTGLTDQWQKFAVEFTAERTVDAATLVISAPTSGPVNVE